MGALFENDVNPIFFISCCPYAERQIIPLYEYNFVFHTCNLQDTDSSYTLCKQEEHMLCSNYIKQKSLEGEVK
jgi:hypothetical protein